MIDLPNLSRPLSNRPRAHEGYLRLRRVLLGLLPEPRLDDVDPVADLHPMLPRMRWQRPAPSVAGWLSTDEQTALYVLARSAPGPVLEIGSWAGKSTICLARGLLAAGRNRLVCCDLFPTEANFREVSPGRVGFFYPPDHPTPMGVGDVSNYENEIRPALTVPGGLRETFERNLREAGVRQIVSVHSEDFRTLPCDSPFALVFCDAMHDEAEITRNSPDLMRFLAPGSILCCHDSSAANIRLIRRYFTFGETNLVDSIFVGRITHMHPEGDAP